MSHSSFQMLGCLAMLLAVSACRAEQASTAQRTTTSVQQAATSSMCPDNQTIDLEDCEFEAVQEALGREQSAQARYDEAMATCGKYDQTTINFCLKYLSPIAERELLAAFAGASPSRSVAAYQRWTRSVEADCTPSYPPEEGGSGYSSRITFCELDRYAAKIDELVPPRKSGS